MKCCCCSNSQGSDNMEQRGTTNSTETAAVAEQHQLTRARCCDCCCDGCLPYNDSFMVTAQVVSIVAFCISWLWYVTFILGAVAMILLQTIWCCRVKRVGLMMTVVIATLTSIGCIAAGVVMIVTWKGDTMCHVFVLNDDNVATDDFYSSFDYCKEVVWAVVAFVTGVLWATTAGCVYYFLVSARYSRCEEANNQRIIQKRQQNQVQPDEIELGIIPGATPYSPPVGSAPPPTDLTVSHVDVAIPAASYVVSDGEPWMTKE